jgi:hypothetical protein
MASSITANTFAVTDTSVTITSVTVASFATIDNMDQHKLAALLQLRISEAIGP